MNWKILLLVVTVLLGGCHAAVPPEVLRAYQARTLYTCCNIHYEGEGITDANYFVGSTLPLGTPVQVESMHSNSVTFSGGGVRLTLYHEYGTEQESFRQYVDKMLVEEDPKVRLTGFPLAAQRVIQAGRVERGMTREQVLLALGYPPTHRTASPSAFEWTYWYNRWITYRVRFDEAGIVTQIIGSRAPRTG